MTFSNKEILNAWKFIEAINLKSTPKSKKSFKLIKTLSENFNSSKYLYSIYLLSFDMGEFYKYFREINQISDEIYNYSYIKSYLFTFKLDQNKKIISDSIFIPDYAALLYDQKMSIYNLEDAKKDLTNEIKNYLDFYSEKSLTDNELFEINNYFLKVFKFRLNKFKFYNNYSIFLKILPLKEMKQIDDEINMNSFYINDLDKVINKGISDKLVDLYINGYSNKQIDIDENKEEISTILQPKNIPISKWPSSIKYQLSLMQSVAVNVAVNDMLLNKQTNITSVNGPPGTGKTTLLKDIFANIIVERAKIMSTFSNPEDGFCRSKKIGVINEQSFYLNKLDERLKGFEIVIASSNNGAVENISKELPQLNQISRSISNDFNELENEYENLYASMISDLNLYSDYSDIILDSKVKQSWGIFSIPMGKNSNIDSFFEKIMPEKKRNLFSEVYDFESFAKENWSSLVKEFTIKIEEIEKIKSDLQKIYDFKYSFNSSILFNKELKNYKEISEEIFKQERELLEVENEILNLPEDSLMLKLRNIFINESSSNLKLLNLKKENILKKKKSLYFKYNEFKKKYDEEIERIQYIEREKNKVESLCLKYCDLTIPDMDFWKKENYEKRQQQTPWLTPKLEGLRGELFILALKIHKYFTAINRIKMRNQFLLLSNRKHLNLNIALQREALKEAWHSIHLMFPVISTTFASFSSMYNGMDEKIIGYLAIDEAGQASPQQAVGAIWRSRNIICVGDPLQIEPVVTIDKMLLDDIANMFKVPLEKRDIYFGESSSVQQLADLASKYGSNKNEKWIGIPLWVHRRCIEPMFSISNKIAYDNKMVLAKVQTGNSSWLDCSGKVKDKQYVKEQGELLLEKILEHWKKSSDKVPSLYVITPFTEIKRELQSLLRKRLVDELKDIWTSDEVKNWIESSIGTVHTFQGKEADIVYFVCGTDETTKGAANWSCSKPNILNVAVTRAKKDFHIIGDMRLFKDKQYYDTILKKINKFNS